MASTHRFAVLLRGVNVGRANRIAMSDFAAVLASLGASDVRTLLNSGNAVCSWPGTASRLAAATHDALVAQLDLDVEVQVRDAAQIAAVLRQNPLRDIASDPSRYLVAFLGGVPSSDALERLVSDDEIWALQGTELYLWMPPGVAESALNRQLQKGVLGVPWTARNWTTVEKLDALL
jgi:uncharacterized protein (DUF1697 family)